MRPLQRANSYISIKLSTPHEPATDITTASGRIRRRYGQGRRGRSYAAIAREYGVSRQLVQSALTRSRSPRRRRPAAGGMVPFVARFPEEQLWRCHQEARSEGKPLAVWLRDVLARYLDGDATPHNR